MFTLAEKIKAVLQNLKTLETSLNDSFGAKTPNVYSHHLKLQIEICENTLQMYLEQIPTKAEIVKSELLYSLENC